MEVHRIGVKFFAADPASVQLEKFIPIFHRWIQKQVLTGHLLIDIHDYSHIHHGPGILLVAHEGNLGIDMGDGRPGLMYYRKTPTAALSLTEHVATILRSALQACRLLEKDARMQFVTHDFIIFANDRLQAPNTDETFLALRPALMAGLAPVFDGTKFQLSRTSLDPKDRLTIACRRL